jgi:hypothetical protein
MIGGQQNMKDVEGSSHYLMEVISLNLCESTPEIHEELSSGQSQPEFK